jgi:hypothetical protein
LHRLHAKSHQVNELAAAILQGLAIFSMETSALNPTETDASDPAIILWLGTIAAVGAERFREAPALLQTA